MHARRGRAAHSHRVSAGRTFDVVDVERALRFIARREEARQDHFRDHRIAHDQFLRILADGGFAPRHRHQAKRAVEVGHVHGNDGASAAHFDDVGIDGDGPRRHDREAFAAEIIAALARQSRGAEIGVEQAPVIVTRSDAQGAAAKEVIDRVGAVVLGDVEDALVHHGDRHAHMLAERRIADIDRNIDVRIRPHLSQALAGMHLQCACAHVDGHVGHADGAARQRQVHRIARRHHRDEHISARSPILVHAKIDGGSARRHVHGAGLDHAIGRHHDLGFTS